MSYVYGTKSKDTEPSFLSSIHESSESGKSEEGSDTEKKVTATVPKEEEEKTGTKEANAKELLEQKAAKISQEYDEPAIAKAAEQLVTAASGTPAKTMIEKNNDLMAAATIPNQPDSPSYFLNTMPIPSHFLLDKEKPSLNSTTCLHESSFISDKRGSCSEISINSDSLSEGYI